MCVCGKFWALIDILPFFGFIVILICTHTHTEATATFFSFWSITRAYLKMQIHVLCTPARLYTADDVSPDLLSHQTFVS